MRGVYRLTCADPNLVYYGSSDNIYVRERRHKSYYKKWKEYNNKNYCSSYKLYEVGGVEVKLVFECPTDISKDKMREIEQTYIDNNNCVNERKSFITEEERKEQKKAYLVQYRLDNIEKQREYNKQSYLKSKIKDI
jgi:hypothetical protein